VSTVSARLVDPLGPSWIRWVAPGIAAIASGVGLYRESAPLFLGAFASFLVAPLLVGRRAPRRVEIALEAGRLRLRGAGLHARTIRGRALQGASTALLPDGTVALTLQGRRRITLELEHEADAHAVRDALGIGHHGFGHLRFPTLPSRSGKVEVIARLAGAAAALLALLTQAEIFLVGMIALIVALVCRLDQMGEPGSFVVIERSGSRLRWPYREVAHSALAAVHEREGGLELELEDGERVPVATRSRWPGARHGLSPEEKAHLGSQIRSAMQRAHGLGPPAPEIEAQTAELHANGASAREWLSRVDEAARRLATGSGYRGAAFVEADLWAAVENHDASPDVRAAAARILARGRRGADARDRILRVAAAARDESTERRIRIAVEADADEASEEIERLDVRLSR
jgi:hypothetical protein